MAVPHEGVAVPDGGKIRIGIGRDGSNQEVQKRKEKEKKNMH